MSQIKEGVYLQVTKGKIGTGHTSSNVVYKNYYAVRSMGEKIELFLLGDDLKPLGLRETKSPGYLGDAFEYQPNLHNEYVAAMTSLGHAAAGADPARAQNAAGGISAAQAKPQKPQPEAPASAKPWWEQS